MKTDPLAPLILSDNNFPVVGIGASAGGLEAFQKLLAAIPEDSGMAYVLVQHLDPDHESILPALLQKTTRIPVLLISDEIKVEPNHIYIIPQNKMLMANDGVLQLSPRPERSKNQRNLPIDLFFNSLAEVHGLHSIGVVLSGNASDGTAGLKAIKAHGGITFVQDAASAANKSMPHSAVLEGVADFILPPEEIPAKLMEVVQHIALSEEEFEKLPLSDDEVFREMLAVIRARKDTDFTYYKQPTIRRRIYGRMALGNAHTPTDYLKLLQESTEEQDALYNDFLIPVTQFFRDPKVFAHLCETVLPDMLRANPDTGLLRFWVAACSTGEEAYSLAMCVKEFVGKRHIKVQIFASDISEPAIRHARAGIYKKGELNGVSEARLMTHFTKTDEGYQVKKELRDMCVFAIHNFLKDPPFSKIDFLSCRNVLIYFEPYLQKKALTTFHYALNPKGFLLLGKSETTAGVPDLFGPAGKSEKLFRRKDVPVKYLHEASPRSAKGYPSPHKEMTTARMQTDFGKAADDIILNGHTPVGVVVNEAMDIVHFRGDTGLYLQQAPGAPTHNLLKLAKSGLVFELRNIIQKAKDTPIPIIKEGIPIQSGDGQMNVTIKAIALTNIVEPHVLILFQETMSTRPAISPSAIPDEKDERIRQLEAELAQNREDMSRVSEAQDADNEDLQSVNEELLSSSEEMQSLNEELETSKEELQSSNEELTVVNQELSSLNDQFAAAKDYAEAIVATMHQPLLVLDRNLRVKSANKAFYKTFRVDELETLDMLIYDLGNRQWNIPALRTLLEEILPDKREVKNFEVRHNFPSIGERTIMLNGVQIIRSSEDEKLILLVIEDVTEREEAARSKEELMGRFRHLVMQAPVAMCILKGPEFIAEIANDAYLELIAKGPEFIGRPLFTSLPELVPQGISGLLDRVLQTGRPYYAHEHELFLNKGNERKARYFNYTYQPLLGPDGKITGIIVVVTEVTAQVTARKRIETQAAMVKELLITAPGFVCTLRGPTHIYELVNERYQQLFGKRKIQGRPILEALPELVGQGFDTLLDTVYETGKPYVGFDIPITLARDEHLEPEERYFNFSYQAMYDDERVVKGILVFGYEVTEQVLAKNKILELQQAHSKNLEEEVIRRTRQLHEVNLSLINKNAELKKMNTELESFAYVSSHDLQEPLRKIQTFSSMILANEFETLSDKGKDSFRRMQKSALHMQVLIQDLLAYSRSNVSDLDFEKTDLNAMVAELLPDFREQLAEKGGIINASALCEAHIIPFQFRQIIHNLLSNALKFAREDVPLVVTIKSHVDVGLAFMRDDAGLRPGSLAPDRDYCCFHFKDNGIGFDPQYNEKIFEIFQRLHGKSEYPGTGIGLAIVKKIVEHHNGIITAAGQVGEGAAFNIYLPA